MKLTEEIAMADVYVDDSLALHTDLYQINMLQTYWKKGMTDKHAVFEAYYRSNPFGNGYTIYTGLERVIDYIQNLRFKESDIDYLRNEGNYEGILEIKDPEMINTNDKLYITGLRISMNHYNKE